MRIEEDLKLDFKDVLIRPKRSTLTSRSEVDVTRDYVFHHSKRKYHGVPIIAANMDTVGTMEMAAALGQHGLSAALHKHYSDEALQAFFTANQGTHFYSMGITKTDYEKFHRVMDMTGNAIHNVCVDVANGYTKAFVDFLHKIRSAYPALTIMAGNVVMQWIQHKPVDWPAVRALLLSDKPLARLHALWTLDGLGAVTDDDIALAR